MHRSIFHALGLSAVLVLTGCQTVPKHTNPTPPPTLDGQADILSTQKFHLQGKIGVRTPQQSGSAFYTWLQQDEQFDIELSGILGIGKTQITGQPGQASLQSAKTGLIQAETAEELLAMTTGWYAPISYLVDWVQARPASIEAQTEQDSSGRNIVILEEGWRVELSYTQQETLPNRLILKQSLETGGENRITMLIQNRE